MQDNLVDTNNEIWMEKIHGRRGKGKTNFKAVVNKVLVSTLVFSTVFSSVGMASAAPSLNDKGLEKASVTSEYGISVEMALSEIKSSVAFLREQYANPNFDGAVVDERLYELASQLNKLESAVKSSGSGVSDECLSVLADVDSVVDYMDSEGADAARVALSMVKNSLGVDASGTNQKGNSVVNTHTVENRQAANVPTRFDDIDGYPWAKDAIMDCVKKGLFKGVRALDADGTGSFNPSGVLTKAEFVTVVVRYLYPNEAVAKDGEQWWEPALRVAKEHGIIANGDAISSDFQGQMTREEMAYVLVNAVESKEGKTDKIVLASQIPDMNKVDLTYSYYVRKAYTLGLITGKDGGVFDPNGLLTRAEGATVAYRMTTPSARKAVEPKVEEKRPFNYDGRFDTNVAHQEWVEGQAHDEPHEGDVVIKADGTRVTLESALVNGKRILGWSETTGPQGVDPYTGYSGYKVGELSYWDFQRLLKDPVTGSVFSESEWFGIEIANYPRYNGTTNGEISSNGWFKWDSGEGRWFGIRPWRNN